MEVEDTAPIVTPTTTATAKASNVFVTFFTAMHLPSLKHLGSLFGAAIILIEPNRRFYSRRRVRPTLMGAHKSG